MKSNNNFRVRYLSHPQVNIDPELDVERWSLNDVGAARVAALVGAPALSGTTRIISSAETKAIETAKPLAAALGVTVEVRENMHENDRRATGFLPPDEFEVVASQFFASPAESVRGWETAEHAQQRIVAEVEACLAEDLTGDVLFVGHGGVGTLLYCHLMGVVISRDYDQGPGGGGNYFEFSADLRKPSSGWVPMETLLV